MRVDLSALLILTTYNLGGWANCGAVRRERGLPETAVCPGTVGRPFRTPRNGRGHRTARGTREKQGFFKGLLVHRSPAESGGGFLAIWGKEGGQFGGQPLRTLLQTGADMAGLALNEHAPILPDDAVAESEADTFSLPDMDLHGDEVVVSRCRVVTELAFNDREEEAAFLPRLKGPSKVSKELSPGGLEEVEIAGIVDVIAHRAVGIGNAQGMGKAGRLHRGSDWGLSNSSGGEKRNRAYR